MTQNTVPHAPATTPQPADEEGAPARMPGVLGLIVGREVRVRARSRGFIASTLSMLVLVVAAIVVPTLIGGGPTVHTVGVVGEGSAQVVERAERLAASAADGAGTSIEVVGYATVAAAERGLVDGAVDAVLVGGAEIVRARAGDGRPDALTDLLQQAAAAQQLTALAGEDRAGRIDAALAGQALTETALSGQDAAQGLWLLAFGSLMLMYLLILQYGTWAMSGVTEEKTNRVIEILLSTARSWQLFTGKVIGVALLGLGQFILVLVAALTAIRLTGAFELPALPVAFSGVLTLWVLVGFAVYLLVFASAGALASKMEDAQSAVSPIMILLILGFFASFRVLDNPDGSLATAGTFVPFLAPFFVPVRVALEAIPLWQHLLSLAISLVAIGVLTVLSSRVYRGGALQFAGRVGWRHALRGPE